MEFYIATTPHGMQNLQFNPDRFTHATLKTFNKFTEQYEFRYEAQYPEPPKHAIETCITKWTAITKKEPAHTDIEFMLKNVDLGRQSKKNCLNFSKFFATTQCSNFSYKVFSNIIAKAES